MCINFIHQEQPPGPCQVLINIHYPLEVYFTLDIVEFMGMGLKKALMFVKCVYQFVKCIFGPNFLFTTRIIFYSHLNIQLVTLTNL